MKKFCFILLLLSSITSFAQNVLKGMVIDENGVAIAAASVFLNNTSIGTTTNNKGEFELRVPQGKYDLIISSIGFETYNSTINTNTFEKFVKIKLKPKIQELQAIIVEPFEKNGWKKWGNLFIDNFIGTPHFAHTCTIKNYKVIKFRKSKKNNQLTAYASEPLIIENKSLGYTVHYQLESFSCNFETNSIAYEGYPFFEPMQGSASQQKRWAVNRAEAYYGSMMHFMRSLYRNKLLEEGFEVRSMKKIANEEKERVRNLYQSKTKDGVNCIKNYISNTIPKDSVEYYDDVMKRPDDLEIIGKDILSADSIAYAIDSLKAGIAFKDYLLILYKNKQAPVEYWKVFKDRGKAMISQLILLNQKPIEIEANGSYYEPLDLMSFGYWSWSEKIRALLPFDYEPQKKNE